jgi:hypothetical protein
MFVQHYKTHVSPSDGKLHVIIKKNPLTENFFLTFLIIKNIFHFQLKKINATLTTLSEV